MYCDVCGAEQLAEAKFCSNCGNRLTQSIKEESEQNILSSDSTKVTMTDATPKKGRNTLKFGWVWWIVLVAVIFLFIIAANVDDSQRRKGTTTSGATDSITTTIDDTKQESTDDEIENANISVATLNEEESSNTIIADDTRSMSLGDIGEYSNIYVGLSYVKTASTLSTAFYDYQVEPNENDQVLITFFEIYNPSSKTRTFDESRIEVYVDGNKVSGVPDNYFKIEVDGVRELDSYSLEQGTRAYVICDFEIPLSYNEIVVYCGNNCIWNLSKNEIGTSEFDTSKSLYSECAGATFEETPEDTIIYSDNYELTYLRAKVHEEDKAYVDDSKFLAFEFSIKNTTDKELDFSLVGYRMRAYLNNVLINDADYMIDTVIDGCINIFDVDSIKAGMSAKFYVAFPIDNLSGEAKMVFDQGYIVDDVVAVIDAKIE